jgi:hypothetical protein
LAIDGWLREIGLGQYAEIFRANDIDGELLCRLTNDDLKDIGKTVTLAYLSFSLSPRHLSSVAVKTV